MPISAAAPPSLSSSFFPQTPLLLRRRRLPSTTVSVSVIRSQVATLPVLSFTGDTVGSASLDLRSAPLDTARAVVHRGIITDQQNKRRGTASTLTRAEVRGGGRKPYAQKKTGNARLGSIRTPLRPGGGVIFGPKPRDWTIKINRKEKRLAISTALASIASIRHRRRASGRGLRRQFRRDAVHQGIHRRHAEVGARPQGEGDVLDDGRARQRPAVGTEHWDAQDAHPSDAQPLRHPQRRQASTDEIHRGLPQLGLRHQCSRRRRRRRRGYWRRC